jgi:hypothetical protein
MDEIVNFGCGEVMAIKTPLFRSGRQFLETRAKHLEPIDTRGMNVDTFQLCNDHDLIEDRL